MVSVEVKNENDQGGNGMFSNLLRRKVVSGFGQDDQYGYLIPQIMDGGIEVAETVADGVDIYSPYYDPATGIVAVPDVSLSSIISGSYQYQTPSGAASLLASTQGQPAGTGTMDLLSTIIKTTGSVLQSVFGKPALTPTLTPAQKLAASQASAFPSTIAGIPTTYLLIGGAAVIFLMMRGKKGGRGGGRPRRRGRRRKG